MNKSSADTNYNQGYFYILIAILLWSSLGVVVRLSGADIVSLIFYSLLVSIIVQGSIVLQKKYRSEISRRNLVYPFFLGLLLLMNNLSFFYAFRNTTIANAVLTHYTAPLLVAFLAAVFLKESITWRLIFSIAVASAGLWILLDGFSVQTSEMYGIAAGLASGLFYAIVIILSRRFSRQFSPVVLSFLANTFIVLMLLPFIRIFPLHAWKSILILGVVTSTVAPILYFRGLQTVTANRAAVLGYIEPVSAIFFSMAFLGEKPGPYSLAGGILILFSGYMTVTGRQLNENL
jgi:drug/metabolite transporter (DMT)-like permease